MIYQEASIVCRECKTVYRGNYYSDTKICPDCMKKVEDNKFALFAKQFEKESPLLLENKYDMEKIIRFLYDMSNTTCPGCDRRLY